MKYFLFILSIILASPTISLAYQKTGSTEFSLDEQIGVYIIDYAFGHEKHVLRMPLFALRDEHNHTEAEDMYLRYDVLETEGHRGKGSAQAIVLSSATVRGNTYEVQKGTKFPFRLLVLYRHDPSETEKEFRVQVNHLPFEFKDLQYLSLNNSELRSYTTNGLKLGKKNSYFLNK